MWFSTQIETSILKVVQAAFNKKGGKRMTKIHTVITLDKPQKAQSHFVEKCKYKVRKKLFGR